MQLDNVIDGHKMTFGDTGYGLYTSKKIPVSFNWSLMLLEIDEDVNSLGKKINLSPFHFLVQEGQTM